MHELSPHPDDFTVLRYAAGDLDEAERAEMGKHLETCSNCSKVLEEIRQLDADLHALAAGRDSFEEEDNALAADDPFRKRPQCQPAPRGPRASEQYLEAAAAASAQGMEGRERLLAALDDSERLAEALDGLDLSGSADRFALLYALQAAGQRIAEGPVRARRFAETALQQLRGQTSVAAERTNLEAEQVVSWVALVGQAHLLTGLACMWIGEYEIAQTHSRIAYSSFGRCGDETSLASVELFESQRRSFVGRGHEALLLAQRAAFTFEALGLEDYAARAKVAQGLALFDLGRQHDAVRAYREALPVFEKHGLWSNYVGALNSIGTSLAKLGSLDEARKEYARALRRLSRDQHRSWLGFIRHGLADVLFAAGKYREAAIALAQASRIYAGSGLPARSLLASLFEIESWARSGDMARARHRLGIFRSELARHGTLDRSVAWQIENALAGLDPDLGNIAELRQAAEGILSDQLRVLPA